MEEQKKITNNVLPVAIVIAAVMISGSIIYTQKKDNTAKLPENAVPAAVDVSVDDDAVLGSADAPVTLIEFSDFQCPYCRKYWRETVQALRKDYIDTGKVKLVYRDFPLSGHPAAFPSAVASECAEEEGKFWEMHDKIFGEQDKLGEATIDYGAVELKKWASEIGLDTAKFNQCLDSNKYEQEVIKDFNDGVAAGVDGTPVTFVNGKPLVGAQPYVLVKTFIDQELASLEE